MSQPSVAALLLLACASLHMPASAASYTFATPLAPLLPYVDSKTVAGPSFVDLWAFNAPASAVSVTGTVGSLPLLPTYNIENLRIELYTAGNLQVASSVVGGVSELDDVPLNPGAAYYFRVSGDAVGTSGGFYSFSSVASPVPEPATGLLLLAGVGMALGAARRAARA